MLRTPLFDRQSSAGARFVPFAGWELPLQFAGIQAEHRAVRETCGVFDVSHMGRLRVVGPQAAAQAARWLSRRLHDLPPGRVRYALALAEDGGILDDLMVLRLGDHELLLVVNAANRDALAARWRADDDPTRAVLVDDTLDTAMLAVQGPTAPEALAAAGLPLAGLPRYGCRVQHWRDTWVWVSRTGYTGEDGAELVVHASCAGALWDALAAAGAAPCGLGARDILRLEAGLPLYGHELARDVTPAEAGLMWAVDGDEGACGVAAARAAARRGPARQLIGLVTANRRVPRPGYAVRRGGDTVGAITSGTLSPTLGQAIAMAFVPPALAAPGTRLAVDIRGEAAEATVVPLPFWRRPR